jgi:hypothetical protein
MKVLAPLDDWLIFSADLRRSDPLTCTNRIIEKHARPARPLSPYHHQCVAVTNYLVVQDY